MAVSVKKVRDQLREVIDPELQVNIVDLGLIYKIKVKKETRSAGSVQAGKSKIYILMTLTTPGCPLAGMFDALVKNALGKIPGLDPEKDMEINLTFDPPWTPKMMTEEIRAELGFE